MKIVRRFNLLQCASSIGIVLLMAFCISCGSGDNGSSSKSPIYLDGAYGDISYRIEPGVRARTFCGELTFTDGDEDVAYQELFNSDGDDLDSAVVTYAAYPDGTMNITGTEGKITRGIINPYGTFAAFVSTDADDEGIGIAYSVRKQ